MTALKQEAIQLVKQMPEEEMPYVIQFMHALRSRDAKAGMFFDGSDTVTPKMKAFLELEQMLAPVQGELDYDQELAEARQEKYGYID